MLKFVPPSTINAPSGLLRPVDGNCNGADLVMGVDAFYTIGGRMGGEGWGSRHRVL